MAESVACTISEAIIYKVFREREKEEKRFAKAGLADQLSWLKIGQTVHPNLLEPILILAFLDRMPARMQHFIIRHTRFEVYPILQ